MQDSVTKPMYRQGAALEAEIKKTIQEYLEKVLSDLLIVHGDLQL